MIYPDVPLDAWARKYRLKVKVYRCPSCGGEFPTVRPVLLADCAGLESEVHDCGPGFIKVVLRPRTAEGKRFWWSFLKETKP